MTLLRLTQCNLLSTYYTSPTSPTQKLSFPPPSPPKQPSCMPARNCTLFLCFDFRAAASDQQRGTRPSIGWVCILRRRELDSKLCSVSVFQIHFQLNTSPPPGRHCSRQFVQSVPPFLFVYFSTAIHVHLYLLLSFGYCPVTLNTELLYFEPHQKLCLRL